MKLYFIRHGNPDYTTDTLTQKGIEQAELLAKSIHKLGINRIYQSTMGRAIQTASYSVQKLNIEPVTLDWTRELSWGDMRGDACSSDSPWVISEEIIHNEHSYPQGDLWKQHPMLKNDRLVQDVEARERALDAFLQEEGFFREGQLYRSKRENKDVLAFFCHGGLTSVLVAHLLNIPFWQVITQFRFDFTSVTKITMPDKLLSPARLEYLNDTSHLC